MSVIHFLVPVFTPSTLSTHPAGLTWSHQGRLLLPPRRVCRSLLAPLACLNLSNAPTVSTLPGSRTCWGRVRLLARSVCCTHLCLNLPNAPTLFTFPPHLQVRCDRGRLLLPSRHVCHSLPCARLHTFHTFHTPCRFDVIGGVFYFLLVVSVMPRCSSMAALLDADSVTDAVRAAVGGYFDALAVSACLLRSEGRLG